MKKQVNPKLFSLITGITVVLFLSAFTLIYPGGSPGKYTGSPGDGKHCTQCHGGSATTQTGIVSSDIDVNGYIPGNTYNITVTLSGSGKKGFEVTPQDDSGNLMGTLTAGSGMKLVNSNKSLTQSTAVSAAPAVWTFQWTAPAKGTGDVTFYGAFAQTKSNTFLSTLTVSEKNTSSIEELEVSAFEVYPNPVKDNIDIDFNTTQDSWVKIKVINLQGKEIESLVEEQFFAGDHHISMILPDNITPGQYLLQLESKEGKKIKRLMVE